MDQVSTHDGRSPTPRTSATGSVNRRESPILPGGLSDEEVVARRLRGKATGRGRLAVTTLAQYRTDAEAVLVLTPDRCAYVQLDDR
jgi:hypothetical protein